MFCFFRATVERFRSALVLSQQNHVGAMEEYYLVDSRTLTTESLGSKRPFTSPGALYRSISYYDLSSIAVSILIMLLSYSRDVS
jgi:hypothetical protein